MAQTSGDDEAPWAEMQQNQEVRTQQQSNQLSGLMGPAPSTDYGGIGASVAAGMAQQENYRTDLFFDPSSTTSIFPPSATAPQWANMDPLLKDALGDFGIRGGGYGGLMALNQQTATGWTMPSQANSIYQSWWNFSEGDENSQVGIWQKMLLAAGYLGDKPLALGTRDPSSASSAGRDANAWAAAVNDAARNGISVWELLRRRADAIKAAGGLGGGGGAQGPRVQVISDEDAEVLVDQTAQRIIGRELSDDERKLASGIIKAIQSKQASGQRAFFAGSDKSGATAQSLAELEVEENFEVEAGAFSTAQQFANMMSLLGG